MQRLSRSTDREPVRTPPPAERPREAGPASQAPAPLPDAPQDATRFLLFWFVLPLVVVLVITKLGLPEILSDWIGRLW